MKSATLLAAAIGFTVVAGAAQAQTQTQNSTTAPGQNTMSAPAPAQNTMSAPAPAQNTMGAPATGQSSMGTSATGQNTMSGPDHNQAVATTSADTSTPAHGSNSFTMRQARHRIVKHGFTQVKDLTKDDQGVWHGTAMQNGSSVKVWEDYKGSVGTE